MSRVLEGRRAFVTGGGAGIGRAIVLALAKAGARVCVTDLDGMAAEGVAAEAGGGAFGLSLDVRDAVATAAAVDQAVARMGGIDAVAANAGVSTMRRVVELTEAEWDFNMDVNAKGVFLTNQAVVRHMLAAGTQGAIVNTASLAAKVGAPLLAHYSASKFAVAGFTQAIAKEVAPHGIRVNCVCPGFVATSMQEREVVWEAQLRLPDHFALLHRCRDEAGADAVHADAVGCNFLRDGLGEAGDGEFAGGVMRQQRCAHLRGQRRGIDDGPLRPRRQHVPHHRLVREEHALGVDVHVEVPLGLRQLHDAPHGGNAGIRRHGVDPAHPRHGLVHRRRRRHGIPHIQRQPEGTAAGLRRNALCRHAVEVRHADPRAGLRQRQHDRAPDARATTRDEGAAPFQHATHAG